MKQGKLYIVATPIGNMEDITYRAVRMMGEVDLILSEDTRTTLKLVRRYELNTKLESYNQFSDKKNQSILKRIQSGENIALVSEAGTPLVSDPGRSLVGFMRENEIEIVPIPGVSALTSLLQVTDLPADRFVFYGFLPLKKGRQKYLKRIVESDLAVVVYESPYRVVKFLEQMRELGFDRQVFIGREMTKKFEEFIGGTIEEVLLKLREKGSIKGEFTVLFQGIN